MLASLWGWEKRHLLKTHLATNVVHSGTLASCNECQIIKGKYINFLMSEHGLDRVRERDIDADRIEMALICGRTVQRFSARNRMLLQFLEIELVCTRDRKMVVTAYWEGALPQTQIGWERHWRNYAIQKIGALSGREPDPSSGKRIKSHEGGCAWEARTRR